MSETPRLPVAATAKTLGVNRGTLYDWFARGCPRDSIQAIAAWRLANVRNDRLELDQREEMDATLLGLAESDQQPGSLTSSLESDQPIEKPKAKRRKLSLSEKKIKADTAKIRAEIAYKRMRNSEKRRDLVSLADVQREAAELAIRIKERLLAVPDEMETRFPAETRAANKTDFEEFIRVLLLELSQWTIIGDAMDEWIVAAAKRIEARRVKDA